MTVKVRIDYKYGSSQNRKKACWRGQIKINDDKYMEKEIEKIWKNLQLKHRNDKGLLFFKNIELYD